MRVSPVQFRPCPLERWSVSRGFARNHILPRNARSNKRLRRFVRIGANRRGFVLRRGRCGLDRSGLPARVAECMPVRCASHDERRGGSPARSVSCRGDRMERQVGSDACEVEGGCLMRRPPDAFPLEDAASLFSSLTPLSWTRGPRLSRSRRSRRGWRGTGSSSGATCRASRTSSA